MTTTTQIKEMDTSFMTDQELANFQSMGATLYEGPAEEENLFDGIENDYSDTDSDVSSIWDASEETTVGDADSSLKNDSWGSPQEEVVPLTNNGDGWGSGDVNNDLPKVELEPWDPNDYLDIVNAPFVYSSGKITDRTYRETDIAYTWMGQHNYEVRIGTSVIRVSTTNKDFRSGDWSTEMKSDYENYKHIRIPSPGRTFESAKAAFDAGVRAAKMKGDFMNKYPRAFRHGPSDNVSGHWRAVDVELGRAELSRKKALEIWRLEYMNSPSSDTCTS